MKLIKFSAIPLIFLFWAAQALAQTTPFAIIQTQYTDTYTLTHSRNVVVERDIKLTNTTASLYVSEYELTFSNYDSLDKLEIWEDNQKARFQQDNQGELTKIKIKLENPAIGKEAVKTINLRYSLNNYLNQSGRHTEIFMPISRPSSQENLISYDVRVITPADYPEVGISKPSVRQTATHVYEWNNLVDFPNKALYLLFSDRAYYKVSLNYLLANKAPYPRQMSIPLVPEGTFQKMYLEDLSPRPQRVYLDADGNFLATYQVPANSVQKVIFTGDVELFTTPRAEVRRYSQQKMNANLLSRYLTLETYWSLNSESLESASVQKLATSLDIYNFVINRLEYDTDRIQSDLKRMGAQWIFDNPTRAVCMEYTDLFIALSRERGIPAREVVGMGVTNNQAILPLSFLGDVLHAWPEYFDSARQIWLPIDPTWADTAGIDYFRNFDLSHIAFVYHGKDATYPLPPGVYKLDPQSRDVVVKTADSVPPVNARLKVWSTQSQPLIAKSDNILWFTVQSEANTFLYNTKLKLVDKKSGATLAAQTLPVIEPMSERQIKLVIGKDKLKSLGQGTYQFFINTEKVFEKPIHIQPRAVYLLKTYMLPLLIGLFGLIVVLISKWSS